jgi:hypothetical protein
MATATAPRTEAERPTVVLETMIKPIPTKASERSTYLTLALMREYEEYYDCLAAMEEEAGAARRV